jgi:error-prone DNA polymerase
LRRRDGLERVSYAHPRLRKVLQKTLGVPLFQEQIMQIAVEVAGFTPGEADELRRVVSSAWKKKAVMHGLRQRLINGMLANGLSTEYADQIYRVIEGFASYGFPESHAASFALITYVSCWLKRHHPDVFVASLLNSQPMGFYPPRQLIHEAQRNGVRFLPLDVNHSHWDYEVIAPGLIRTGLRCINGLSELDAQKIIAARGASCGDARSPQSPEIAARDAHIGASPNAHVGTDVPPLIRAGTGHNASQVHETTTPLTPTTAPASLTPFRDLEDFVRRTRLARKTCTRLAQAGALSALESDARLALYRLQGINYDQGSFFYASEPVTQQDDGRENISRESQWQRVQREFATKGFALDTHPLKLLRPQLQRTGTRTAAELTTLGHGAEVQVAGLLTMMQKPPTAKGVAFLSLEDETGISNIILMPEVYQRLRLQLYASPILHLRGRLEARHGVRHLKASELLELADL